MAEISKIQLPGGGIYDLKDATARSAIAGGISFIVAWDGASTPVVSGIPDGVVVTYNGTTYTGTLSAETTGSGTHAQAGAFYLVKSSTTPSSETLDIFDEYIPVGTDGSKYWEKLGDTKFDLSGVVTDVSLSGTTTSAITGYTNSPTATVVGTSSTFSVTQPTISVTPSQTYLGATASGANTAWNSTDSKTVVTGYNSTTTDTFVKSISATDTNKLVTTSIPNVTSAGTASSWTFTMGSGDNSETLIIGGSNSTAPTLGTAITAATGSLSSSGTGAAVVTAVSADSTGSALTGLGTASTADVVGTSSTFTITQPTVSLGTNASTAAGRVQVATGISSATASGGSVGWNSTDSKTVLTGLGTASTTAVVTEVTANITKGNGTHDSSTFPDNTPSE